MARATPATRFLEQSGTIFTLHEYAHDPARDDYGIEAVVELGIDPQRVLKTLVVACDDGQHVVAVVPAERRLDLKALAPLVGAKHTDLATADDARRLTGYVLGGISPLGQKRALLTVVDESALAFDSVFVSAGRRGLELELRPADLVRLTDAKVARIARA
jgi:Cys-tRNA(Pro)/Cys-tRNA(Cys) deacylase